MCSSPFMFHSCSQFFVQLALLYKITLPGGFCTFLSYRGVTYPILLSSFSRSLIDAAMDLGGRPFQITLDITLPLIAPAMLAGWLLAFTLSLDDLVISSFASGPGASTLPMVIFSKVKLGVAPDINALATIIITIVGLGVVLAGVVLHRQEQRRILEAQTNKA